MALLPKVKLKAMLSFPSAILDGAGIDVTRVNGAFRLNLAYDDFAPPVPGLTDPTHQTILVWNSVTNQYAVVPVALFGVGGNVPEAPNDGTQYARQALMWTPVSTTSGITEAPNDGTLYGRENATWVHAVPEAPNDGQIYSRKNLTWTTTTSSNSFIQGGTGAVNRVMQDKVRETVSITDFGAKPDYIEFGGAVSITAGSNNLQAAAGFFHTADIGKAITVPGAGASGGSLITTITGFTDAQHVTLAASAGTTLSAVDKMVAYGTDNSPAILAAIQYGVSINAEVRVTNGGYGCWSKIVYNFPGAGSLKLVGNGRSCSLLWWPNANGGLQINYLNFYNTSHIRDLTFRTSQPPSVAGSGLSLTFYNQVPQFVYDFNDVSSCTFIGNDNFPSGVNFWTDALLVVGVCGVNFDALNFLGGGRNGNGINIQGHNTQATTNAAGSGSTLNFAALPSDVKIGMRVFNITTPTSPIAWLQVSTIAGNTVTLTGPATSVANGDTILFQYEALVYNLTRSNFLGLNTALVYSTAAQGLTISQTVFQVCTFGVEIPSNAFGVVQLFISNNWFATDKESIIGNTEITDIAITNNGFAVYNNVGDPDILFAKATRLVITGNDFVDEHSGGTTPTAISIIATGAGGVINSNSFYGFNNAVVLNTSTSFVKVTLNNYFNTTTPIANFGTSNTITPL